MKTIRKLENLNARGKRILVRVDFNVPFDPQGEIADDSRIRASLPTIELLLQKGAKIILISHLGRPDGKIIEELRLNKIAEKLEKILKKPIKKLDESIGENVQEYVEKMEEGEIVLLENIRFHAEEEKNDPRFIQQLAALGDIFVNDGFGVSHRAHASSYGIGMLLPAYAGLLMEKEINALSALMENPEKPFTLILGGAKIKDKLGILKKFVQKAEYCLIGGGIANTFLNAQGFDIGASLCEKDMQKTAQEIIRMAEVKTEAETETQKKTTGEKTNFLLPQDVIITSEEPSHNTKTKNISIKNVKGTMKIFDIGSKTIQRYTDIIHQSKTIFWNGPMGLTEYKPFQNGTYQIAKAITETRCASVIGGGDSSEIIKELGFSDEQFTYISTGGGASLEFLSGKELPGIKILYE